MKREAGSSLREALTRMQKRRIETIRRAKFGPWKWDIERGVLVHEHSHYEVDLERMTSSAELLDWIFQLEGKTWMTREAMGHFIEAIQFIVHPQGTLCSMGCERGPWAYDPKTYKVENQ